MSRTDAAPPGAPNVLLACLVNLRLAWLALAAALTAGCDEHPFPQVKNVSELQLDERVVIGQIQYADGDINKWVKGSFERSWPWFSYDLDMLYGPRVLSKSVLGPRGGV